MSGFRSGILHDRNKIFSEFKGALTEQYVMQLLTASSGLNIYYYTNDCSNYEIDFVVDNGRQVVPFEVKAEINMRSKCLKVYREKYDPKLCANL